MSSDDSTMAASRSFSSAARLFSVTSRKTRTTPTTCPPVNDGGRTVVNRRLSAVAGDEHGVVREPDDVAPR